MKWYFVQTLIRHQTTYMHIKFCAGNSSSVIIYIETGCDMAKYPHFNINSTLHWANFYGRHPWNTMKFYVQVYDYFRNIMYQFCVVSRVHGAILYSIIHLIIKAFRITIFWLWNMLQSLKLWLIVVVYEIKQYLKKKNYRVFLFNMPQVLRNGNTGFPEMIKIDLHVNINIRIRSQWGYLLWCHLRSPNINWKCVGCDEERL